MKALILVGGFGTRLRPLTLTLPKPLVPFANKPMIEHQIIALAKAGVTEIVLAVNYRPEVMEKQLKKFEEQYGVNIHFSIETEPLGTAGPLALASDILGKDPSPFFVLNSDVVCPYPFEELLELHKAHQKEGTIIVTRVDDPSKYGVVVCHPDSTCIERFVEKPTTFVSNKINAGIYVFNPDILKRISLRPTSIEKETFPAMASERQLHAMDMGERFWMDVGQPKDYIIGIGLFLGHLGQVSPSELATGDHIVGNVMVHPSAKIGKNCKIGPNVTIGPNVVIGDGVRLLRCCLMENVEVESNTWISSAIIGWNCHIGSWVRMEAVTVLGEDVKIGNEIYVNGGRVLPHKVISKNVAEPEIIM